MSRSRGFPAASSVPWRFDRYDYQGRGPDPLSWCIRFRLCQTRISDETEPDATARLLATRKKPADRRQNTDDQAVAGPFSVKRGRTESRRQAARCGKDFSEHL